jgi:hypothetical protein
MSDGFLGRWSKRKLEVKQGKAAQAEDLQALQAVPPPQLSPERGGSEEQGEGKVDLPLTPAEGRGGGSADEPVPLTLEDVKALTAESDFSRFAAGNVSPEVKNAAMKKLFADPRYNVMDGLDVYTGDYSRPDPIPHAILRKLASARFLGLFDEEEKREDEAARQARDVADNPTRQTVAQSSAAPQAVPEVAELPEHADPDLRLQQDHAAPGEDPGRGTG